MLVNGSEYKDLPSHGGGRWFDRASPTRRVLANRNKREALGRQRPLRQRRECFGNERPDDIGRKVSSCVFGGKLRTEQGARSRPAERRAPVRLAGFFIPVQFMHELSVQRRRFAETPGDVRDRSWRAGRLPRRTLQERAVAALALQGRQSGQEGGRRHLRALPRLQGGG